MMSCRHDTPHYWSIRSTPCPGSPPSSRSLPFRLSSPKRRGVFFSTPPWKVLPAPSGVACCKNLKSLRSLVVPLPFALLPMQVVILSSSDFTMVCPRLKQVSIATDIPADEAHDKQLRRITKFVEARYDGGFELSSLEVYVLVVTPILDQAQVDYIKTWESSVGEVAFSVRF